MKTYYYVMRSHSHTDRQQLWKVMSRRFADKWDANNWLDFVKDESTNLKHEFFLITKEEES
jgi:hypothetical protein